VSPLERMPDDVATHQLLSGQLGPGPTPMLSYLCVKGSVLTIYRNARLAWAGGHAPAVTHLKVEPDEPNEFKLE